MVRIFLTQTFLLSTPFDPGYLLITSLSNSPGPHHLPLLEPFWLCCSGLLDLFPNRSQKIFVKPVNVEENRDKKGYVALLALLLHFSLIRVSLCLKVEHLSKTYKNSPLSSNLDESSYQ